MGIFEVSLEAANLSDGSEKLGPWIRRMRWRRLAQSSGIAARAVERLWAASAALAVVARRSGITRRASFWFLHWAPPLRSSSPTIASLGSPGELAQGPMQQGGGRTTGSVLGMFARLGRGTGNSGRAARGRGVSSDLSGAGERLSEAAP